MNHNAQLVAHSTLFCLCSSLLTVHVHGPGCCVQEGSEETGSEEWETEYTHYTGDLSDDESVSSGHVSQVSTGEPAPVDHATWAAASNHETFSGGCHCGKVTFELVGLVKGPRSPTRVLKFCPDPAGVVEDS